MILIVILICLVVQRFGGLGGYFRMSWFEYYLNLLHSFIAKANKWVALLIIILPIYIVAWILHAILAYKLFGIFYLLFSCAVLFFCIDARDLRYKLVLYFDSLITEDFNTAAKEVESVTGQIVAPNISELNRVISKYVFVQSFTQLFAALFWFIIFGVYGAIGYSIIFWLTKFATSDDVSTKNLANLAVNLQNILDWFPVRFLGLTYALAGHFKSGFSYCHKYFQKGLDYNKTFAAESGLAAIGADLTGMTQISVSESHDALSLIDRTLIIWIVAAVVRVLIGLL